MNILSAISTEESSDLNSETHVLIDTRRVVGLIASLALVIVIVGTFANIAIYQIAEHEDAILAKVMRRFDLGHEPSIPAWFSSLLLFANAMWLILIGTATSILKKTHAYHWIALGLIFVGLSIDEAVMFHEMIDNFLLQVIPQSAVLIFPWVAVGATVALVVFFSFLTFLLHLEWRFRKLFVLSGAIFVGGAVGVEFIAGGVIDKHGVESLHHTFVQMIEESMDIAGSLLFFYSLSEYWRSTFTDFQIKLAKEQ
ncbi:MAG: hypothetical protein AAF478_07175 [Pseudomonadota bacterium]